MKFKCGHPVLDLPSDAVDHMDLEVPYAKTMDLPDLAHDVALENYNIKDSGFHKENGASVTEKPTTGNTTYVNDETKDESTERSDDGGYTIKPSSEKNEDKSPWHILHGHGI